MLLIAQIKSSHDPWSAQQCAVVSEKNTTNIVRQCKIQFYHTLKTLLVDMTAETFND